MVGGQLVCLGSCQHLKGRFGGGYVLQLRLAECEAEEGEGEGQVEEAVAASPAPPGPGHAVAQPGGSSGGPRVHGGSVLEEGAAGE